MSRKSYTILQLNLQKSPNSTLKKLQKYSTAKMNRCQRVLKNTAWNQIGEVWIPSYVAKTLQLKWMSKLTRCRLFSGEHSAW
ncbi:hypothetical protein PtB15_5B498 [Puccinia triticina]|nr:hypothetical protein PtB15_5B498 [Puccinia triticina]